MPRELPMSQNLRDFMDLWHRFSAAKQRGEDLTEWRRQVTAGLRVLFPPLPDDDPRLWKRCLACDDTGYQAHTTSPALYSFRVPVRVARTCDCEKGQGFARAQANARERAQSGGPRRGSWSRT